MDTLITYVEPKFFQTAGVSLLLGRDFGSQDNEASPKVVIISERVARHFFGNQNPIGKRIGLGNRSRTPNLEVVGVSLEMRNTLT